MGAITAVMAALARRQIHGSALGRWGKVVGRDGRLGPWRVDRQLAPL